jgi:DNA mismatch repair protein MutS
MANEDPDYTPMIREYFQFYNKGIEKYGEHTAILYQNGSFYELFGYDKPDGTAVGNVKDVAKTLNFICSRKNKKYPISSTNPLFCGFQTEMLPKNIQPLINAKYNVIIYNQRLIDKTNKDSGFERFLYKIITPGTYIEGDSDRLEGTGVLALMLTGVGIYSLACTYVETITGHSEVFEIHRPLKDCGFDQLLDELYRYISMKTPREIIAYTSADIYNKIHRDNFIRRDIPPAFLQIDYQTELLGKIFDTGALSPIEFLNLEKYPDATLSFCLMMQYIYEINETILKLMRPPIYINYATGLQLVNDAIYQLDVYGKHTKGKTLFDILNKTSTALGTRMLRDELLTPQINTDILTRRYNAIDKLKPIAAGVLKALEPVYDLSRLFRRAEIGIIHPHELLIIHNSIEAADKAFNMVTDYQFIKPPEFATIRKLISDNINLPYLITNVIRTSNIDANVFVTGVNPDVEELRKAAGGVSGRLKEIVKELNTKYAKHVKKSSIGHTPAVILDLSGKTYCMKTTKTRWIVIAAALTPEEKNMYNITTMGNNVRITCDELIKARKELNDIDYNDKLAIIFKQFVKTLVDVAGDYLKIIGKIAELDFLSALALVANDNKYTRPIISTSNDLFINGIRHPIIELMGGDEKFITNDVNLTDKGMLLYGINACGKSVLLKSVGLCLIMAQIGSFVPAESMVFVPRHKIITRVTYEDNMHKSMSSFVVEMTELKYILATADKYSLILGDEICKGTENISATSIVSSAINTLAKNNIPFIFTSHLHDVAQYVSGIQIKHLAVKIVGDTFTYERKLADGSGPSVYGIEVCKGLGFDDAFITECRTIRNKLEGKQQLLLADKRSHFNTSVIVDQCSLCGKRNGLQTHHIQEQHTADSNGYIEHFHKNNKFNLLVLCEECHRDLHLNNKQIQKHTTTNGKHITIE